MYHKVHLRLFFLFSGITSLILCAMTLALLSVSEKNLTSTQMLSFQKDINTLSSNLENQATISDEWLSSLEGNGHYYIALRDNGKPFIFQQQKNEPNVQTIYQNAWTLYDTYHDTLPVVKHTYLCSHRTFHLTSNHKNTYSGCVITLIKEYGTLEMMVLCPLKPIYQQIKNQRVLYFSILIVAILIVGFFSWYFTGKLLLPLEESRKQEAQFISAASHELRTPLAVILSCIESYEKNPINREALFATLKHETLRMAKLIEDMLTLSRHDNQSFVIEPSLVEIDTLLLDSYDAFHILAKKKHQHLEISLPETALTPVNCDAARISQVIAILLHNAISYSPKCEENPASISLILEQPHAGCAVISVIDHGPGIPDIEKEKVFERFYRSDSSRSDKEHFGLGLSIASEIIKAHRGAIKITDTPGGGATFIFSLETKSASHSFAPEHNA